MTIRHRVLAFDIMGDSLVVLVELPRMPNEVGRRAIDIYEIAVERGP